MNKILFFTFLLLTQFSFGNQRDYNDFLYAYDSHEQVSIIEVLNYSPVYQGDETSKIALPPVEYCFEFKVIHSFKGSHTNDIITYKQRISSHMIGLEKGKKYLIFSNNQSEVEKLKGLIFKEGEMQYHNYFFYLNQLSCEDCQLWIKDLELNSPTWTGAIKQGKRVGVWTHWLRSSNKQNNYRKLLQLTYNNNGELKNVEHYHFDEFDYERIHYDNIYKFYSSKIKKNAIG